MNHKQAQIELLYYCLYDRRYIYVSHELKLWDRYFADIFCIDNQFRTIEIEIKVNSHDLMTELRTVKNILNNKIKGHKHLKHLWYLKLKKPAPNRFYFAVPTGLVTLTKYHLQNTSYGIIELIDDTFKKCKIVKRGSWIHTNKIDSKLLQKSMQHLSYANLNLLGKLK